LTIAPPAIEAVVSVSNTLTMKEPATPGRGDADVEPGHLERVAEAAAALSDQHQAVCV
jgi:hypothetical protein